MSNLTYNGQIIDQRDSDNFVNMSQMAKIHGKKLNDWTSNQGTKDYVEALALETTFPVNSLLITVTEGFPAVKTTWGHPLVAIAFGQWISPMLLIVLSYLVT